MPHKLIRNIKTIAKDNGVILLYHSIAHDNPIDLEKTLHNVSPVIFYKHIEDISDHFELVSLQEFTQAASKNGLAAITFDDGYKNVLENAVPILESFNCPTTLFLNPLTFSRRWNS